MIRLIIQLFKLLPSKQIRKFYVLQLLVVFMAFAEIIGIASIAPFMALVGDLTLLERKNFIAYVYNSTGLDSPQQFIILVGISVLVILLMSALVSMYATWKLSIFANKVGTEIADQLYTYYLKQSWLFHASGSTAQLTKQIANETERITSSVLQPLMQMNARIVLVFTLAIAIAVYDPFVAGIGILIFLSAYFLIYKLVKGHLKKNGETISKVSEERFRLMNEGFGGIKDVLLLGRTGDFIKRFNKSGVVLAHSLGSNTALSQIPRYLMELIAFSSMILLVLYLVTSHQGDLGMILPAMSLYAFIGFKLLPAFQHIYGYMAIIKGNISAFESIKDDLQDAVYLTNKAESAKQTTPVVDINLANEMLLQNISFFYPGKTVPALNKLTLTIPANKVVGIVGPSGSGKSTAIDILLGLVEPQEGHLIIDGIEINESNRRSWQNSIGFVPQSIFLSEGSIAENVAFGVASSQINNLLVKKALELAHLDQLVQELPEGINTKVGERGVQLSGGQRQRIGIARALYNNASVLIFDEATSALDGITEEMIMNAIHDFSGKKTIIMIAHRLKTVQRCDIIYFIDKGAVLAQGTYAELIENNAQFKKMATYS